MGQWNNRGHYHESVEQHESLSWVSGTTGVTTLSQWNNMSHFYESVGQ